MIIKYLEVSIMDNGEVLCMGQILGMEANLDLFLFTAEDIENKWD